MRWYWQVLGALVLGVMLAQWTWVWFAPHSSVTSATPARGANAEAAHLFGVAAAKEAAVVSVPVVNARLLGVFAAGGKQTSFAVMQVDGGHQMGVAQGEEVAQGTKLVEVHADHVVLERGGARQSVMLDSASAVRATGK